MEIPSTTTTPNNNTLEVNKIYQGNSNNIPFPDSCVDLAITSPPYWGLRDYGIDGQLGLEPTFQEYIDKMLIITKEIKRVLKKSGSFYLNMGDTYSSQPAGNKTPTKAQTDWNPAWSEGGNNVASQIKKHNTLIEKSLCFIPERLAIRMEDEQGWIPRNKIIWHKPNHMPSSVKDRLTNSWEYLYHFVKSRKYYYNLDNIRVPHMVTGVTDLRTGSKVVLRQKLYDKSQERYTDSGLVQYLGKFEGSTNPESFGSPRARTQRDKSMQEFFAKKGSGGNVNLTDRKYKQTDEIYGEDEGNRGRTREHLDNRRKFDDPLQEHKTSLGFYIDKNRPVLGDRSKTADESFKGSNTMRQAPEPGSPDAFHPDGKNPGDVIEESPEVRSKATIENTRDLNKIRFKGQGSIHWDTHPSKDPRFFNENGKNPTDYWEITTQPMKASHFATFPERLCLRPILSSCPQDGIVFDPFMGSGTVAVVAEKINKKMYSEMNKMAKSIDWRLKWVGMELNQKYIDIAYERLKPLLDQPRLD